MVCKMINNNHIRILYLNEKKKKLTNFEIILKRTSGFSSFNNCINNPKRRLVFVLSFPQIGTRSIITLAKATLLLLWVVVVGD